MYNLDVEVVCTWNAMLETEEEAPLTIMTTTISITITILSLTLHTASSQDIFSGSNFLGKNVPCVKTTYFLPATSLFCFKFMVLFVTYTSANIALTFYVSKKKTFKLSACLPCKYIYVPYMISFPDI